MREWQKIHDTQDAMQRGCLPQNLGGGPVGSLRAGSATSKEVGLAISQHHRGDCKGQCRRVHLKTGGGEGPRF